MRARDPVCGRQIDLGQAVASAEEGGCAYFFCLQQCHQAFVMGPRRLAAQTRPPRRGKEKEPADA